jgi:hypothetical protein
VSGNWAYVAERGYGLRVIDVGDPVHPAEVGHYRTPGKAWGVAAAGNYACVADNETGLQIYEFYGAGVEETPNAEVRSANAIPTFVRGVLELPQAASHKPQAASWLLDISGRKVMELRPGANDVGRMSPGVYFVRLASGVGRDAPSVNKVVIAK